MEIAKPAVTALYVMAALSAGHEPGDGPLGDSLNRAIDYVLSTQIENGLFTLERVSLTGPEDHKAGQLALYNHGICGTVLGEVYGMTDATRSARIETAIEKALAFATENQRRPIRANEHLDRGGWRYIKQVPISQPQSDLSVTSWQIMFMRSAHNAGFDFPKESIDQAINYVRMCFDEPTGGFQYATHRSEQITRGMTGAGVLCLFLTGNYDDRIERQSGAWLLRQEFTRYNQSRQHDRYFYAAYYCSQAAYQLGGEYWSKTYVPLAETLVAHQHARGNWDEDHHNREYSDTYSTAMAILALTPPYQLLPIYQR
ncbi:prenyltransferase/squalene oxidase repeat-containing protein [Rubripirellula tenax]|nr:prenyltransferase/squalene oxidase repeat-containing protein [Rubripirellula tenax]